MENSIDSLAAEKRPNRILEMFDKISPRYDALNRVLSLGRDLFWRRALARRLLAIDNPGRFLDLAAGTGDQLAAAREFWPAADLTGLDFSEKMLKLAAAKLAKLPGPRPTLVLGDALLPPFEPASFDSISISFGLRNIGDRPALYRSALRLLKPAGRFLVLDLVFDRRLPWAPLHKLHLKKIAPWTARLAVGRQASAYRYLADSIISFPHPASLCDELEDSGFVAPGSRIYTFWAAALVWDAKPGCAISS
jgi:demethylmenaquinone methyltransferase/2-methoxy-6-polyprenyl-1,4-benzoquinol methylase